MGQIIRRNRSISHGFRDISIFVFCNFCEKFKMAASFGDTKLDGYSAEIPCGSKISSKLRLQRFFGYSETKRFSLILESRKVNRVFQNN